jgi:acyl carrier protein
MSNVEEVVRQVLLGILDITEDEITVEARFVEDLRATSIDMIEIVSTLQNTFDVDVDESEVARLQTVEDAVNMFKAVLSQKESPG